MQRPFPLPSDVPGGMRTARPAVYAVRAAAATLRGFITDLTPTSAAKKMFGGDPVTDYVLRAATAAAEIAVVGWAQELGRVAIYDMIQSITSLSTGAEVISRGLQLNLDGIAELRVPGRVLSASAAGQWTQEGMPAPVRSLSFSNAAILRPRKLQVISVYTREMVESSNIEAIVRQTLGEATGLALDAQMFSANAASANGWPVRGRGTAHAYGWRRQRSDGGRSQEPVCGARGRQRRQNRGHRRCIAAGCDT
jgi:hypothetical protein